MPPAAVSSSVATPAQPTRVRLELDAAALYLFGGDGSWERVSLEGAVATACDAACASRFVRHVSIRTQNRCLDLITAPEQGAIAPRAARLPGVPGAALIIDGGVLDTATQWIRSGGGLGGRTISELARLACIATSQFAIVLGECIAHAAAEITWERVGPMRGGGVFVHMLRPLEEAARDSQRAGEALVAALARGALLQPYSFV
jgi:hypothetical protein